MSIGENLYKEPCLTTTSKYKSCKSKQHFKIEIVIQSGMADGQWNISQRFKSSITTRVYK